MSQFVFGLTDDRAHLLAISLRKLGNKLFQYSVVAFDQAITPAFEVVETFVVLARRGIDLIDQRKNFVERLIAHQFADEHHMALARNVSRVFWSICQSLPHCVSQRHFVQQIRLESRETLAQINQSMQLFFDLCFAFFAVKASS